MKRKKPYKDLTGQRFGRLTAIEYLGSVNNGKSRWRCECDCGNTTIVEITHLRSGATKSCGCYRRERTAKMRSSIRSTGNTKHNLSKSRLYSIWTNMKTRCLNPRNRAYKWYGAVGITICSEWLDFEEFRDWALKTGYKDNLTIERKNPFLGYCPENCEWIPLTEQRKNQRRSKQWH